MPAPKIGDIVHFHYERGVEYPAIVTRIHESFDVVDLTVIVDLPEYGIWDEAAVPRDEGKQWYRSWHWPEKEEM